MAEALSRDAMKREAAALWPIAKHMEIRRCLGSIVSIPVSFLFEREKMGAHPVAPDWQVRHAVYRKGVDRRTGKAEARRC